MREKSISSLTAHRYYSENSLGRDFFVGDLHGKYLLLMQGLQKIAFDFNNDRLFSVGDLIDRGEASFHSLLLTQESWFIPVVGNHEQFLFEFEDTDIHKKIVWYQNGGEWWEYLHPEQRSLAKKMVQENFSLTLTVATLAGRVGVVHAQYPLAEWPIDESALNSATLYDLLWSREWIHNGQTPQIAGVDFIVSGHTPLSEPLLQGKQLFIDTGCGHSMGTRSANPHLTICEFKKGQIELYALTDQGVEFSTIKI